MRPFAWPSEKVAKGAFGTAFRQERYVDEARPRSHGAGCVQNSPVLLCGLLWFPLVLVSFSSHLRQWLPSNKLDVPGSMSISFQPFVRTGLLSPLRVDQSRVSSSRYFIQNLSFTEPAYRCYPSLGRLMEYHYWCTDACVARVEAQSEHTKKRQGQCSLFKFRFQGVAWHGMNRNASFLILGVTFANRRLYPKEAADLWGYHGYSTPSRQKESLWLSIYLWAARRRGWWFRDYLQPANQIREEITVIQTKCSECDVERTGDCILRHDHWSLCRISSLIPTTLGRDELQWSESAIRKLACLPSLWIRISGSCNLRLSTVSSNKLPRSQWRMMTTSTI